MLGDVVNRRLIVSAGALWWGLVTLLIAFIPGGRAGYHQAMVLWALNGLGLAAVIPSSQSILADYFPGGRGVAFGWMYLTGAIGGCLGALFGTNIGSLAFASPVLPIPGSGYEGWRVAFSAVGILSLLVAAGTHLFAADLRHPTDLARFHAHTRPFRSLARRLQRLFSTKDGDRGEREGADRADAVRDDPDLVDDAGRRAVLLPGGRDGPVRLTRAGRQSPQFAGAGSRGHTRSSTPTLSQSPGPGSPRRLGGPPPEGDGEAARLLSSGDGPARAEAETGRRATLSSEASSSASLEVGAAGTVDESALPGRRPGADPATWADVWWMLRIPSFGVIILQGIVGSTPWNAMVFFTLWLQLLGASDFAASLITASFAVGAAIGGLLGTKRERLRSSTDVFSIPSPLLLIV